MDRPFKRLTTDNLVEARKKIDLELNIRGMEYQEQRLKFRKSEKMKFAYKLQSDKMQTAKSDMITHIMNCIAHKDYTVQEFLSDPTVYLDKAIMGNYINNKPLVKSIINQIDKTTESPF